MANRLRRSGSAQKRETRDRARKGEYEALNTGPEAFRRKEQEEENLRRTRKPSLPTDMDIEAFELEETRRQQRQQLDVLEKAAKLSSRETEVMWRVRKNMTDAEIASELEITTNNVYVTKHNATKKLKEARKAAGF